MAWTGVNPIEARAAINKIKNEYTALIEILTTDVRSNYVNKIAEAWGSPAAQEIMGEFGTNINQLINSCTSTFSSVVSSMNGAARSLLEQQNYQDWVDVATVSSNGAKLDVSSVKDNLDGNVEADLALIENANAVLNGTIVNDVSGALNRAKHAVHLSSGFIGGGMQDSLINSLDTIRTRVKDSFAEISKAITDAAKGSASNLETGAKSIASDNFTISE